ncbi:MAG: hypothetical protein ACJAYU_002207 [Bradymonadia bacterium]|jgi:hypothetical protein
MNQRNLRQTIESLNRSELRELVRDLAAWVGEGAVPKLIPHGPIRPSTKQAQLALSAVDVDASRERREHVVSLCLGLIRAERALGGPAVDIGSFQESLVRSWAELVEEASAALRFDFPAGLELAREIVEASGRLLIASTAYGTRTPRPELGELLGLIGERVTAISLDERTFGVLVKLCGSACIDVGDAWSPIDASLASHKDARRWLTRLFEGRTLPTAHVVPLLRALEQADGPVEDVVQVGEISLDAGIEVLSVMIQALHNASRIHEARFWIGEGRLRHPGAALWAELEATLF